jgi:cytochrome c oxidase subunit 2
MSRLLTMLVLLAACAEPEPPPEPAPLGPPAGMDELQWGEHLFETRACLACHRIDSGDSVGPALDGVAGRSRTLADGRTVTADADYLRAAIAEPDAAVVSGYPEGTMPAYALEPPEMEALIGYLQSLSVRPH